VEREWFETFFDEVYPELWGGWKPFTPERTEREASFVVEALALEPPTRILDLACGHGRHCLALAKMGFQMVGVDLTQRFLDMGARAAQEAGLQIEWVRQDMRRIEFDEEFDAAINMFGAFGYFEDEGDDLEVLRRIRKALRPGGKFFIDVVNRDSVMARFAPCVVAHEEEGVLAVQERRFDPLTGVNHTTTRVFNNGERRDYALNCRLFNLTEMNWFLNRAGLRFLRAYGSYDGDEFERLSHRMLVAAERPAEEVRALARNSNLWV